MKKAMTALFAIAAITTTSAFVTDRTDVPAPTIDNGAHPPLGMSRSPPPPLPPQLPSHRPVLFSATVATDTLAEAINKLTALIPVSLAKHYEVHIEMVPIIGDTDGQQPLRGSPDLGTAIKKAAAYRGSFVNESEAE